jgi:hypothetical protein
MDSTQFKPHGKPIITVFANYHNYLNENQDFSGFEIRRAYLGYEHYLSKQFYAVVKIDIGSPDDVSPYSRIRRYAYFKNAALRYTWKSLRVDFGLIDMQHFILQEKFWGYRYIARSFSDRYRFGPKADIGFDVIYTLKDVVAFDLTISNGEGYTNIQRDNTLKAALGFTLTPLKGLSIRGYIDAVEKNIIESTLSTFVGYKFRELFRIGFEYNYKFNQDFLEDHNMFGISTYGTVCLHKKVELFGRYDWLSSNIVEYDDIPWNLPYDGSSVIAGIQYTPIKLVKLSLNYQDWVPYAKNEDNLAFIYLNVEFKY